MEFSLFGTKMTADAGILSLMDDLGKAMASGRKMWLMGGGNPGHVEPFSEIIRERLLAIAADPQRFQELVGAYAPPQGDWGFRQGLARLLRQEHGWDLGPENIALTNGSQSAFFMLFNLFGGRYAGGREKKILLPMVPEYIGYADLGLAGGLFVTSRPRLELLDDGMFKYHIDFDRLPLAEDLGAICISRPTNPSGNVITDAELARLLALATDRDIPLILDSAYGLPFPGMVYGPAEPLWTERMILCLSLSKLGLPAVRTGIVVAAPAVIEAITAMNAIMALTPTNFGAVLAGELVASGRICRLSREVVRPFYQDKMERAVAAVRENFHGLPCRIHRPEGAMFLWLWFAGLPISSLELYQRLKAAGALVVSGHYFFPGLTDTAWRHQHECLRVTYSQDDVGEGLRAIAGVVRQAYSEGVA
jgi:valine--pyruvate aminotransferase